MSAQYGSVTIDGILSSEESAYSLLGQGYGNTGFPAYGGVATNATGRAFVFNLVGGVSTTGGSTVRFNTDWDSTTGYNGYEYNVRLTASGAFLYTGSDGQTLVNQLTDYAKTPGTSGYSNVEFALPSALLAGSPQSAMIATTINGLTSKQHALAPPIPPGAVYGSVTLDGKLSEWTSADYLGLHNGADGFDLSARFTGNALVLAIKNPGDRIGEYSTIWFNTDMNTSTGMNVYGNKLIGAEDYIFFENSGLPVFHNQILDYAYNANHDTIEIAIPDELIGSAAFEAYFAMHPGRYWGTMLSGPAFSFTVPGSSSPESPISNVAPVITSNGGSDSAGILIAENSTAVMSITATDANVGQTLTYAITGGADASMFAINTTTGTLSFRVAPNFEAPTDADGNNIYNLIAGVSDGNGGSDSQALALTVTNVDGVNILGTSYGQTHTGTGEADTVSGGGGNDTINGLGGNDTLNGDAGNDTINGGDSRDVMTGGAGSDRFLFLSTSNAGNSVSSRDVITDFVSGSDKIDVSAIDNNVNTSGNGAFTFLATAGAMITVPGQIHFRYDTSTGAEHTIIEGNNNRDLAPEFQIDVVGHVNFAAADFIL